MRKIAWILILFELLFMNVFVPSHTRGAITFNGESSAAESCHTPKSCCETKSDSSPHAPSSKDRACCAVCYIASTHMPTEPFINYLRLQEMIRISHELAVAQVRSLELPLPFWPAGPPLLIA